jgi:aminoglycoside 2''-phosphotransferase
MKQMDNTIQNHLETIKRVFSHEIVSTIIHEGGDDFLVIEVNGEWMFRFPRQDVARKALAVERAFLARFKSASPLPVPDHKYSDDDFVGYPKIRGALLTVELFQGLSLRSRERIARQMGQFLSAIHHFSVDEARRLGLTEGWSGYHQQAITLVSGN